MPFPSDVENVLKVFNACLNEALQAEKPVMHQALRGGLFSGPDPAWSAKTGGGHE